MSKRCGANDMTTENAAGFDGNTDDVFGRIAGRYDLMCDIFSFLSHRRWKQSLAVEISETQGVAFLDMASGTGHIVHRVAKLLVENPKLERKLICAADVSPQMLDIAKAKNTSGYDELKFEVMNAYNLRTVVSGSVDIFSVAFGMKIMDRSKLLAEAARVLKPGGIFFCLEAAKISNPIMHRAYLTYMSMCMPIMASLVTGGDRSAYNYLLKGIYKVPTQAEFGREIESFGFCGVTYRNMSMGIVALHRAVRNS
jgi:demethylmenaquinone methyltransferase / 2-methoxy-6-polyprenyl-1,4-benzoquinol methylase